MILHVTSTTDRKYLGIDFEDIFPLVLPDGGIFTPERIMLLASGEYRFITSSYIIDAKEI